ncbi:hypothetical protein OROHE_018776 [Orobanche hederae]
MANIVLYPSPGMGHLVSMVELGKLILTHHPHHQITIVTVTPPFNAGATVAYIKSVSAATTSLTFHSLPAITLPLPLDSYDSMNIIMHDLLQLSIPHVHQFLQSLRSISAVSAFIIDMFCSSALYTSDDLDIPCYFFFTSGANCLSTILYLPTLHESTTRSFKDMEEDEVLHIPGVPPTPPTDMIVPVLDRNGPGYASFLEIAALFTKSSGIIINTFNSLENRVPESILRGDCVPNGHTPPLFCVGPLIVNSHYNDGAGDRENCLEWLDRQPEQSVVFLCFGSLGVFSAEQLKEIAIGLERSGKRFIWAVRSPPAKDRKNRYLSPPEPDLDFLLPEGFLERTRNRGMVIKSWAPQVEILNHGSVGGFVTHCGWNSVLEAVCAGVPMVAWPLYAEQRLNRLYLVEGLAVALPLKEDDAVLWRRRKWRNG